ncbi:hypothetical protein [Actinomadura coerulea]|uniref:hypothetical protein n=1 Tax=Actinomadura coerulea TaxID=46159 RepID=UPI0034432B7D
MVWEAIETVVSRAEVRAAVATVNEMVPPPDAEAEADDWRAEMVGRFATVSGFIKQLTPVIEFGAKCGHACGQRDPVGAAGGDDAVTVTAFSSALCRRHARVRQLGEQKIVPAW